MGRIISEITRILIITLLPVKTRFSLLWPSDTLFEDSPLRVHLSNCHQSWNSGSNLLEVLSVLHSKQQLLICKNYFESIGIEATKKLIDKLENNKNEFKKYPSELRLCTAMGQLMYYKDILELESRNSPDNKLKEKRDILKSVLEQINLQEASLVTLSNALDRLENLQVLQAPRNWWDPRFPKSYSFFNSFKVAVETLATPKAPLPQRVFLQTEELRDLNSNFHWEKLSNAKKEEFLTRFQTQVNKNTPPNERLLLPQSLEFCRYTFGHSDPAWKIINPAISDKPAMVQIYYSETCKTGKTIKHRDSSGRRKRKPIEN